MRFLVGLLLFLFASQGSLLVAQSASSASPQYFFNQANFPTGQVPESVSIADMNGDARADLVVANLNGPSVSILLGQPDGTFGLKTDFMVPESPTVVVTADFNGDGKIDVAVTGNSGVSVLLGDGDGALALSVTYPSTSAPYLLEVADLNKDGKQDLVFAGSCGNTCGSVSVLLSNGDGTFKIGTDVSAGFPNALTVADLNGDGTPDLAVATTAFNPSNGVSAGLVSVLLGNGDGTFQPLVPYASQPGLVGIAAGDVTGDKLPDLVVTSYVEDSVWILKGNGDGTFLPEQRSPADTIQGSAYIQLLDVNKDGKLDLVMSSTDSSGTVVRIGNGDGTFLPGQVFWTGSQPALFNTGDVSGDGNVDLAVVDSLGNYVTVLLGNGDGTFSPRKDLRSSLQSNVTSGAIGDLNGDSIPDIAVTTSSGVAVVLGKGDGTFNAPLNANLAPSGNVIQLATGDFNRDGHLDLLADGSTFLPGNGDGTFGTPVVVNSDISLRNSVVGDFNNDGYLDLVEVGNESLETQPMQVLLGKGDGTFQPAQRFWDLPQYPDKVVAGDFNGDGNLDLALTLLSSDVAILLGTGNGSFGPAVLYPTDQIPSGLGTADLNGDGIVDLVVIGTTIDVFLGKGDGTFPTPAQYQIKGFPFQVASGDFNGDGKLDLAVTGSATGPGYLGILFGNGDGTLQTPLLITDNAGAVAPKVADLNGDGIDDVFVAAGTGSLFLSAPKVIVSPSMLSFGTVATGATSRSQVITVTNSGNSSLQVTGATTAAPFSISGTVCQSALVRLATCEIPIVFAPSNSGQQSGQVAIQQGDVNAHPVLLVSGTAVTPSLTYTPASVMFAGRAIGSTSSAQTVTLTNTSSVAVNIASVSASGPFSATSQCGASLAAAASCSIAVTFTPTAVGQQTGALNLSDNAVGGPQSLALSGSGVAQLSINTQAGGSTTATVKGGAVATYALALNAGPGFGGTSALTCSGAPSNAACTIAPSSLALSTGGSSNFSVTVTTSQQAANSQPPPSPLPFALAGVLLGAFTLPILGRRLRLLPGRTLLAAFFATLSIAGCGGGSSGKPTSPPSVAPGTYQLTITATAGNAKATQTLTLTVD